MKGVNVKTGVPVILLILLMAYLFDFDMFKALLTWTLGGLIVLLLNVSFAGELVNSITKNREVQDLLTLLREAKEYLRKILDNQKENNHEEQEAS